MIKAALIDLDGTLLDSMGMWENLGENILNTLGFATEEDINEIFKSFTVKEAAQYYKEHFPIDLSVEELENFINSTIKNAYLKELPLKTGAENFLKNLKENNILIALVTTTNSFLARNALKRLNILNYFDLILSCEDLNCSKNESTIYDKAINDFGIKKEEAFIIEDAFHAVKTAKNNNYLTIAIFDSFVTEQEEIKNLADYYLIDFKDSNKLIEKLQRK